MSAATGTLTLGTMGEWRVIARPAGEAPLDVSWFRGAPTAVGSWEREDPFGPKAMELTFPAVTILDRRGVGELYWLYKHVDIDLEWVGDLPANYPYDRYSVETYVESFRYSSAGCTLILKGAGYQPDNYLAKPEYSAYPLPYEHAMARQLFGHPDLRLSPLQVEWPDWWDVLYTPDPKAPSYMIPAGVQEGQPWSGLTTRRTGDWDPALTSYIQTLLSGMYTHRGRFTLDLRPGRRMVLCHRDFKYEPDAQTVVLDVSDQSVSADLTEDWSQSIGVVYGQGTSLQGVGFSGMRTTGDGSATTYEPLAALRQLEPLTDDNGWLDPSAMRKEVLLELPAGLDEKQARRVALSHLQHFADPGLQGTITLTGDPRLGSSGPHRVADFTYSGYRVQTYPVHWDGGFLAMPHAIDGAWVRPAGEEWYAEVCPILVANEADAGVRDAVAYVDWAVDGTWSDDGGSDVPAGDYWVLVWSGATSEPTAVPALPAGMHWAGGDVIPRSLILEGMALQLRGVFGLDEGVMVHIVNVKAVPQGGAVTLTVDSKFRDALTVEEVRLRGRDALSINRQLIGGLYEPPIPDQLVPWNYAEGSGFIPSSEKRSAQRLFDGIPADIEFPWTEWTTTRPPRSAAYKDCYIRIGPADPDHADKNWAVNPDRDSSAGAGYGYGFPIRMAQQGQIRLLEIAAYDADGNVMEVPFHFSLYYSPGVSVQAMPRIPAGQSGQWGPVVPPGFIVDVNHLQHYPFHDNAWERFNADGTERGIDVVVSTETAGLVRGWGTGQQKAGYWPGSSSNGDAPTGLLRDEKTWEFNPYTDPNAANAINPYSTIQKAAAPGFLYAMIYCDAQGTDPVFFAGRMLRVEPGTTV